MESLSDEELIARSRLDSLAPERKAEFLDELFRRYHTRVALWCLRVTGNRDTAADLAQDVFLKVHRSLDAWRAQSKFSTWLYSITRNHCLNHLAAQSVRPEATADPLEFDLSDGASRIDHQLALESEIRQMKELMQSTLDETEARVMTLHYGEEFTLDAISRLLGLTNASGAKAYVVSARRKLKAALGRLRAKQSAGRPSL